MSVRVNIPDLSAILLGAPDASHELILYEKEDLSLSTATYLDTCPNLNVTCGTLDIRVSRFDITFSTDRPVSAAVCSISTCIWCS